VALHYQTEYRLGRRGRVSRSYTGARAFVAIVIDLTFGMFFELLSIVFSFAVRIVGLTLKLVGQILRVYWKIMVAAVTMVVYVLTTPFALVHRVAERVRWEGSQRQPQGQAGPVLKPDWGLGNEI
jgi:hypothetical protein